MLYFKHYSTMRNDLKIRKLINRYGLEGYGLYNLIIESITDSLCDDNPSPELQENCSDIAELYNGNTDKINEMVAFMINLGLLEISEVTQRISCEKVYKFIEKSATRSLVLRKLVENYKQKNNIEHFVPDSHRQSQTNLIDKDIDKDKDKDIDKDKDKDSSLSACADEEKNTHLNDVSLLTYMKNRISEEYKKLYNSDYIHSISDDMFFRKLYETIDKTTFDGKLNALITRIKNTKNKEFVLTLSAKTLLNKLNDLQIAVEPPKVNNRYKSGNVKTPIKSMTLREQILSTPGLAEKYCLEDVIEDEIEKGIRSANGALIPGVEVKELECYKEC